MNPMHHRPLRALVVLLILACAADDGPPVPAGAKTTADGVRWMRLKRGAGPTGARSPWWSVDWTPVPCDSSECRWVYNGSRDLQIYDPFRSNLMEMEEGEVRRVWVPRGDGRFAVYDVHLARVFPVDDKGEPIVGDDGR